MRKLSGKGSRRGRPVCAASAAQIDWLESRTLLAAGGGGTGGGGTGGGGTTTSAYPTSTLSAPNLSLLGPTYTFTVTYLSNKRIRTSQLDNNDLTVTGPNGYSRTARFVGYIDNVKQVIARYKVSTPNSVWNAADNGVYTVSMNGHQLSDGGNNYAAAGALGTFTVGLPVYPTSISTRQLAPQGAVDVTTFGAIPNDGKDDTAAIQKAINTLPRANGVPDGATPIGGVVWFPAGQYDLSSPLTISSGVILRGAGSSSILNNTSNDGNSAAIQFVCYFTHNLVARAGVEDLSINTVAAKGIQSLTPTGLVGIMLERLTINAGGAAIDLRQTDVYSSTLSDITINNPGSTAIWITVHDDPGNSAINRIENVVIQGAARTHFSSDTGMVVLGGDENVDNLSIGDTGADVTPLTVIGGTVTFTDLTLPSYVPSGTLISLNSDRADFDQLAGLSSTRRLIINDMRDVHVGKLSLGDSSDLSQAVVIDSTSHLTIDQLYSGGRLGNINPALIGVGQMFADATLAAPAPAIRAGQIGAASHTVVFASTFGAIPNDGNDDTAAIQAAIDSLPRGNGLANTPKNIVGGTVVLAEGLFNTSASLRIPSGVYLEGQGFGTVIYCTAPADSQAILLTPGKYAGYNIGSAVSDLSIYTTLAEGIKSDSALTGGLFDFRAANLGVSAGGIGIDLRPARAFHSDIENIQIASPGADAMWIGDDAGYSADNLIRGVQLNGATRPNFVGDRALFVFTGQNTLDDLWIENSEAVILPLYVSGAAVIRGMWLEYPSADCPNSIVAEFENASSVSIDRLLSIDYGRKLQLRNAHVTLGYVNIADSSDLLYHCLDLDENSTINIGTVNGIYDAGMLDDPRVSVGGVYNQSSGTFTQTSLALEGVNNLADPSSDWQIQWGDTAGTVQGSSFIDDDGLHIHVDSNPNMRYVSIVVNLNVTDSMVGKQSVETWRFDGPGTVVVYTEGLGKQFSARAMNTQTAIISPETLKKGSQLIILIPPVASGDFIISDLAVFAIG